MKRHIKTRLVQINCTNCRMYIGATTDKQAEQLCKKCHELKDLDDWLKHILDSGIPIKIETKHRY